MDLSIVILAAGKGTRMKSSLPKVLHKICGFEMLYYVIKEAKKISDDIKIVLYHEAKLIKEQISRYFDDIEFILQDHENYPGTGGAVMGIEAKHKKILVLNADMPLIQSSELEKFLVFGDQCQVVMSVIELENPDGYGRVLIENQNVKKIVEQKDATKEELKIKTVNAGVYLFERAFLKEYLPRLSNDNSQGEYYITDLIEFAVQNDKVVKPIIVDKESFKGVNSKYDLSEAETIMQNRIKKRFMANGVIMRLPETIYIEQSVEIEGESIIENGVSLIGNTKISNSHIKSNSIVEESLIENSSIGPICHIRPGCSIKNSHLGNFVEVKKSTLTGVKAGHLSYLGDSEIKDGTNVGAGTITCNYDGKNKHKTKIGKNVFIGSDTQLIAPVTIEDDVIIAAGSTINKDIKKGSLAISRAPIKIIKNFFYKFFGKDEL
jgi:bifunctional UDP-N-acetylglucosamine pyrophosphorylase/glucosamine-1-phosphate N-acetyltransferase